MTTQVVDVTAIFVSYNTESVLREAIGRLRGAAAGLQVKIAVVDNASRDNSVALIRHEFPECHLIVNEKNVGFGRANNQALGLVEGRYVLLVNSDAFVSQDTLTRTIAYMNANPRCGILGVKLLSPDGTMQPSARNFPTPWNLFLARTGLSRVFTRTRLVDDPSWDCISVRRCDWVPGCYYLVRKEVIDQIGLFDPRYFLYYEEIDHCFAAKRAGWEVICYPGTTVIHIGGESARTEHKITRSGRQIEELQVESELLYFRKNHGRTGVWLGVMLLTVGDAILAALRLWKCHATGEFYTYVRHAGMVWAQFVRTHWGTRPTR